MKKVLTTWNKSLMARLVGASFLLLVLTVSLVSYLVYIQARRSLTQSVFDRLHAVSTLKEDGLNRWVDQQRLDLVFIAWQPEVRSEAGRLLGDGVSVADRQNARAALADYLKFVVTSVSDSDELFIMDLNGQVLLSTQASHEGQSHAKDQFFIQGRSTTYVQPVYTSSETNRPTITVATPLFDTNKRRVGILAGHLNLARVDRIILERTGLGTSGETYLVNPQHEFVSAALFANPDLKKQNVISFGIEQALKGKDGTALYTNYQGVPVIGYYNWLDDRGVVLMAEMSQDEAFAPARQLALTITEVGLLASLLLAGFAYLLARQIARPILAITRTAQRVAGGDLTQEAPVMTHDEVGLLASAFNQMTAQLRVLYAGLEKKVAERTADLVQVNARLGEQIAMREQVEDQLRLQNGYLEALHETTLGLVSHLELQDLFETLVTRAGDLMHTEHGFIYIVEPDANIIECKVGVGMFSRLVGFQLPPGEGLGGKVWQSGQPLMVDDYDHWEGRAKSLEYDLIRSIIGVPLTMGNQVLGVIGLAYPCGDEKHTFGEPEVALLTRFAQLASLALVNARLYARVNEARAAAEAANESKSAFLANVSHELRTPLTSILGFARIIQKRLNDRIMPIIPLDDPRVARAASQVDENLKIILAEGDRLTTLINDLLDLEKIRAGKMIWHMEPLQVMDVIDRAAAATASLFDSKGLAWIVDMPEHLPQVNGDRDRLVQVVINLISNAVKFTAVGAITCRAHLEQTPMGTAQVVISLTDQGIGISEADQALVFEKFRQVGDTLTNKPKGTGLGLPICKEIIEYHGGRMWLESQLGVGSTFFFSLPVWEPSTRVSVAARELEVMAHAAQRTAARLAAVQQAAEAALAGGRDPDEVLAQDGARQPRKEPAASVASAASATPAAAAVDASKGEGKLSAPVDFSALLNMLKPRLSSAPVGRTEEHHRILVIDDDASIRQLLRQELEAVDYHVFEARDGREALAQIKQVNPDLVLLDVMMPEMSGYDVAAVIRSDPETMRLPIVIVSVMQDQERGYQVGADRYFNKPIDIPMLLSEVEALLAHGPSRKKVLVVDEDESTVQILCEALLAQNYQVSAAYTGQEGLQRAEKDRPDLLIVNSLLSEQYHFIQALRFEKGLQNIIFLLFR